ncbi:unnamed protein product [Lathyrus oleraceus]
MEDLKQLVMRWKRKSRNWHNNVVNNVVSDSNKASYSPSGFIFVFVGYERKRFTIPLRFLKLHIFQCLLIKSEEEFGLQVKGCLVLPCEISLFREVVKYVKKDERKYGKLSLEEFANMVFNSYEKKNTFHFTPLLRETTA